jgi:hypothetical protein
MVVVPDEQVQAMRNDPKDRHVAACAVCAPAQVIVTINLKDSEPETLSWVWRHALAYSANYK